MMIWLYHIIYLCDLKSVARKHKTAYIHHALTLHSVNTKGSTEKDIETGTDYNSFFSKYSMMTSNIEQ